MKIFDTHAHYDSKEYKENLYEVIDKCKNLKVDKIVLIGTNVDDSLECKNLCEKLNKDFEDMTFYWTLGIHPDEVPFLKYISNDEYIYNDDNEEKKIKNKFAQILQEEKNKKNSKLIAIGEIGLDYHGDSKKDKKIIDNQKVWFVMQLMFAKKYDLPVVIHSRDACEDTYTILKDFLFGNTGIMHCYSYSYEMAKEYIKLGLKLGVGGVVTFKNGRRLQETVEKTSLQNIVLETDCPYMSPEPFRGEVNDSSNIQYIISKIAKLKNISEEEVAQICYNNSLDIYRLNKF